MKKYKQNHELNFLDRFLYKLIIGMVLVLLLVIGDRVNLIKIADIQTKLNEHVNILKIVKTFNGPNNLIPLDEDNALEVISIDYSDFVVVEGGRRINLTNNEVKNVKLGVVVKIIRNGNYEVYIKGVDGLDYVYKDLEKIDVNLYQYVKTGHKIGTAEDKNFDLFVWSKGKVVNLDDVYPI